MCDKYFYYQNTGTTYTNTIETSKKTIKVTIKPNEYKSSRGCGDKLTTNNPASQYQRQKIIQNTVRVPASLYTMNLAGLSGYQYGDKWHQMSDRLNPSKQIATIGRHATTRNIPGSMAPGGIGGDIKHNSYNRYLNKLKGKSLLRRGIIPSNYGSPNEFNRAAPMYGGKTFKTSIINHCDCPVTNTNTNNNNQDNLIYGADSNSIQSKLFDVKHIFADGNTVWSTKNTHDPKLYKATITDIALTPVNNTEYTLKFDDNDVKTTIENDISVFIYDRCSKDKCCNNEPVCTDTIIL